MEEWQPGAVVGAWVVDRYLRRGWTGSMLEVHRARDPKDLAVVKICDVPDADMRQRFGREGSLLLKLSHPGIVPVRSAHFDHDPPYLVLEAVSGEDLGRLLERSGALQVPQALMVAERVCDVLVYLHGNGRFHRDLKPASILVDSRKVLVTDFGIARETGRKGLTEPGTHLGSVEYAPPEWAKGKADPQSWDLYALGVVLHEMLTGAPAFPSKAREGSFDRALEVMNLKKQSGSLDPGQGLPEALRALVGRLTATDPAGRPSSAKEVHQLLVELLGPLGQVSLPPAPERQVVVRPPPPPAPGGEASRRPSKPAEPPPPPASAPPPAPPAASAPPPPPAASPAPSGMEPVPVASAPAVDEPTGSGGGTDRRWLMVGAGVVVAGLLVGGLVLGVLALVAVSFLLG